MTYKPTVGYFPQPTSARRKRGFEPFEFTLAVVVIVAIILVAIPGRIKAHPGVSGVAAGVPPQTTATDPCTCENLRPPQPLKGTLQQTDFAFTHTSDVDQGQFSSFSYILKNDHPANLLPAKWVKAGLEFDRIAVNGCGRNDFDALGYTTDSDAPVEYGPQAQFKKPASAYVPQSKPNTSKGLTTPKLKSRIFADLAGEKVDFRFTAFIQDGVFHYEAQNYGSHDFPFDIPLLAFAWSRFQTQPSVQWDLWTKERLGVYALPWDEQPKVNQFVISSSVVDSFSQDIVEVHIFRKDLQRSIATGRVSLYLPVARK